MKRVFFLLCCCLCSLGITACQLNQSASQSGANTTLAPKDFPLTASEKRDRIKAHAFAFVTLNERIRDPYVTLGPDGFYYLTGTTAGTHWGDTVGIRLWRSKDLAEWEDLGFVWELYRDGRAQNSWHFDRPRKKFDTPVKNPLAIWAPEIHYMNGTWWIPHSVNVRGHGLLRSITGKPEGPYESIPLISEIGIDSHLYQENGKTYYLWQANIIAEMNDSMTKLVEEPRRLEHDGKHPLGYEGVFMLKVENKYVLIASGRYGYEPTNTYDLYYAVSDNLNGPYGPRRMAIKNAGHGNLIRGPHGKWWSTAFDHEFIDSETMERWNVWLVPVDIHKKKNDIVFEVKDTRFRPTEEDQASVRALAETGVPEEWKTKRPWWRPKSE